MIRKQFDMHNDFATKRLTKCKWEGTVLDYMSPSRGDKDLRTTYPIHSYFRAEKENTLTRCPC